MAILSQASLTGLGMGIQRWQLVQMNTHHSGPSLLLWLPHSSSLFAQLPQELPSAFLLFSTHLYLPFTQDQRQAKQSGKDHVPASQSTKASRGRRC